MASRYVIAVVGGATAGAEVAGLLADRGTVVVVFEQHARPYGKIEDGLPRWHLKLRQKEYETVNNRLVRPDVHFVPLTKIGRDIDFREIAMDWGFTAVVLAVGAWRDRPFLVEGAEQYVGRGLIYQNPFIYWFNHFCERDYNGPQYQVEDGAIVVRVLAEGAGQPVLAEAGRAGQRQIDVGVLLPSSSFWKRGAVGISRKACHFAKRSITSSMFSAKSTSQVTAAGPRPPTGGGRAVASGAKGLNSKDGSQFLAQSPVIRSGEAEL